MSAVELGRLLGEVDELRRRVAVGLVESNTAIADATMKRRTLEELDVKLLDVEAKLFTQSEGAILPV